MRAIILKLDDLQSKTELWDVVTRYIIHKKVKASIGIIGKSLEENDQAYFDWIKELHSTGRFEFWNHGYTHAKHETGLEFYNSTYEDQYKSIENTQRLGLEKLGIQFYTFGAPWNKTDANTRAVLEKFHKIKVWLRGDINSKSKLCLNTVGFACETKKEKSKFFVDSEKLMKKLDASKSDPYTLLQFHPNGWKTMKRVREFYKIIDHLKPQPETKFMTPIEYYRLVNTK
jgi:hypothetical protein